MIRFIVDETDSVLLEKERIHDSLKQHRLFAVAVRKQLIVGKAQHKMLLPIQFAPVLCRPKTASKGRGKQSFEPFGSDPLSFLLSENRRKLLHSFSEVPMLQCLMIGISGSSAADLPGRRKNSPSLPPVLSATPPHSLSPPSARIPNASGKGGWHLHRDIDTGIAEVFPGRLR